MDTETITAKWNNVGRIFFIILPIFVFILFIFCGCFLPYEQNDFTARWQMVVLMTGLGTMNSLMLTYLALWAFLWKLEIKNNEITVFGFLKKRKTYKLSSVTVETHKERIDIKHNGKTIARMSMIMIENCYKIVRIIESAKD